MLGATLFVHGLDEAAAGLTQFFTGQYERTLTSQLFDPFTGDPTTSDRIEAVLFIAANLTGGRILLNRQIAAGIGLVDEVDTTAQTLKNTGRTVEDAAETAEDVSRAVDDVAPKGTGVIDDIGTTVHKNSLDYVGDTHVYRVRGPQGTYKIGESAQGVRVRDGASIRGEQQARRLTRETGDFYESEIRRAFPDKRSAREYETRLIERFRRMFGDDALPGNITNR